MRKLWAAGIAVALAVLWLVPPAGVSGAAAQESDHARLERYAATTWASFVAMVDTPSGLPTDQLHADGSTDPQTSITNIGAYLWSAVAAERLGIIGHDELVTRLSATLATLNHMERHQPDGQFYNWYDHRDGAKLTTWPPTGDPLDPILSSVDNGWLATGLKIVRTAVPELSAQAGALYDSMDFGFYYVPDKNRILFNYSPAQGTGPCCYDTVVSESRIADYIGIANGQLPRKEYYGRWRYLPRHLRLLVPGDQARRLHPHLRRRLGVRRQLPLQRHPAHAELGRVDVRGADALAVRPRGAPGRRAPGARTIR